MTITFLDLYNECAGQPWSMFDNDAESEEDFESALRISINKAISYLWNFQPWSFKLHTYIQKTKNGNNKYNIPEGLITRNVKNNIVDYGIKCNNKKLTLIEDYEELEEKVGEPEGFWLKGENVYLYPTPDDTYTLSIDYLQLPYGLNSEDEFVYELSADDDFIDIPEKYEKMFSNCLISLAMMYAIADENDENYSGYKKQYEDALVVLMKYCSEKIRDRRITW